MGLGEDEDGVDVERGHEVAWTFYDDRYFSVGGAQYVCIVYADIYEAMGASEPSGWTGWTDMFFTFDPAAVTWESVGDACDSAAMITGAASITDWAATAALGVGYGPMNDADFEETFAGAVEDGGGDYAGEWAGNVMIGWSQESLTGDLTLSALNYGFVYEIDDSNKLVTGEDGSAEPIEGAGDATTPVDGFYQVRSFYGWGFSR